ncbi:MAG: VWA domain-containing protein [Campylobacterota bacterium]
MSFLHPEFIYLMLPILLVLFGLLLTQNEVQERFFTPESLAKLRVDTNQLSAKVRNLFYFLMFLFIILALAGPVVERGSAKVKVKDDLFFIALDISDSMLCQDVYPNRLELGKQKIMQLLQREKRSRVGLIAFAQSSYLVTPPSLDHKLLTFLLKPINSSHTSEHGTNVLNVLKAVNKQLEGREHKRVLLVSDGGDKELFSEEIAYAKEEGIQVYVLAIGTENGGVIPQESGLLRHQGETVISRLNLAIEGLAKESGGAVVQAGDLLPFLESMKAESTQENEKPIYFHFFILPIGLAMVMFLIATSSFHRGEKYYLPSLLSVIVWSAYPAVAEAGMFDYQRLESANQAYTEEEYHRSAKVYNLYALENESPEAAYNAANAYYKMGRYKMAAGLYESIYFADAEKDRQRYHNLGNALAKMGEKADLKKAIAAYEKALEIKEDPLSRENLEMVKKALQEREEERKRAFEQQAASALSKVEKSSAESKDTEAKRTSHEKKRLEQSRRIMSDLEAKKWLRTLERRQYGQAYKIEVTDPDRGVNSAKAW